MRKTAAFTIATLMLAGCHARAVDHGEDEAIYQTVRDVLCARAEEDRERAVSRLADQVEAYRGIDEDDTASGVVDVSLDDLDASDCPKG